MSDYGRNSKKYAEAMQWRDWQTCDLICDEHQGLLQTIGNLEQQLSKLRAQLDEAEKVVAFYSDTNNWSTKHGELDTYIDGVISVDDIYAPWGDAGIEVGGKRARAYQAKYSQKLEGDTND